MSWMILTGMMKMICFGMILMDDNVMKNYTCRICGKTDKNVQMLVGGVIGYSHEKCRKYFGKHVDIYLEYVVTSEMGAIYLAEELIKARDRVYDKTVKL
jgi:hypothetical protein